jgi:hypothetical protein
MIAYVREVCPSCGNLRSVCSDPDIPWHPQRTMCLATAAREVALRRVYRKYKHPAPDDPEVHETDGMQVWVSMDDLTPDDNFI